jgi:hypothetical protein
MINQYIQDNFEVLKGDGVDVTPGTHNGSRSI